MPRRKFLTLSAATMGAVGSLGAAPAAQLAHSGSQHSAGVKTARTAGRRGRRPYNSAYSGEYLNQVAFPTGRHRRGHDLPGRHRGALACLAPQPSRRVQRAVRLRRHLGQRQTPGGARAGRPGAGPEALRRRPAPATALGGTTYGLPRFANATFKTPFPVRRGDAQPIRRFRWAWSSPAGARSSPATPDNSSLPVAGTGIPVHQPQQEPGRGGVLLQRQELHGQARAIRRRCGPSKAASSCGAARPKEKALEEAAFSATVSEPGAKVNYGWFRGGWWDALTMAWKDVAEGACYDRAPLTERRTQPRGDACSCPFQLAAGASKTIALRLAWFSGQTNLHIGKDLAGFKPDAGPGRQLSPLVCRAVHRHQRGDLLLARPLRRPAAEDQPVQRLLL